MPLLRRAQVLVFRIYLGCISLVPHVLWTTLCVGMAAQFSTWQAWKAWASLLAVQHVVVYTDMILFSHRSAKNEKKVLIIGGGLSGIRCAVELIAHGYKPLILEKSHAYGGTWNANDYPGCKSDIATSYYLFSKWFLHFRFRFLSHGYSTRQNSKWYANTFAAYAGLERLTYFDCEVKQLVRCEAGGYTVTWLNNSTSTTQSAHFEYVVFAIGVLSKPKMIAPASRHVVHASEMTDAHSSALKDKNVLIVGAGCSGTQMTAPLIKEFSARSVTLCAPRGMWFSPCTMIEHPLKTIMDGWMQFVPWGSAILRAWDKAYGAFTCEAMRTGKWLQFPVQYTRACYKMVGLEALSPSHSCGGTRTIIDYDFFDVLYYHQNVNFIQGRVNKLVQNSKDVSVQINGKPQDFDFVIMATGFETEFSARLTELNLNVDVSQNFFGICIQDLPDCFFMYGPNTNSQGGSITDVMEIQSRAIVNLIDYGFHIPNSWYDEFSEWIVKRSPAVLTGCKSWYTNGSGRNLVNYPGSYREYETRLNMYLSKVPAR